MGAAFGGRAAGDDRPGGRARHDQAEPDHDHVDRRGGDGRARGCRHRPGEHGHGHVGHQHGRQSGLLGWLGSLMGGHSHDSSDAIDQALEASAEGIHAVRASLVALGITALLQGVVVARSGSVALLGDTLHNLADASTAVPLWLAFTLGRRPPTRRYTYGYGRAEDLAGIFVVAMIALSAVLAGWESLERLLHPHPVRQLWAVAAASIVGVAGNELVATYRIRVGRRIGSAALVADGLHARTDGLTSLAVLAGAAGVAAGFGRADPIAGLVVTLAILVVLRGAAREVWWRLMDAVDPELVERARRVLAEIDGVEQVGEVRVRWLGHRLRAEARVVVDRDLPVAEAHDIAEHAEHQLLHELPRLRSAIVHLDPCRHAGPDPHARTAHHRQREGRS